MFTECLCNFEDIIETEVTLSPLNSTDISWVQPSSVSEGFLCPSSFNAKLPNRLAHSGSVVVNHDPIAWSPQTMSPETISIAPLYFCPTQRGPTYRNLLNYERVEFESPSASYSIRALIWVRAQESRSIVVD